MEQEYMESRNNTTQKIKKYIWKIISLYNIVLDRYMYLCVCVKHKPWCTIYLIAAAAAAAEEEEVVASWAHSWIQMKWNKQINKTKNKQILLVQSLD